MARYCIITGTSSGIGAALALALLERRYIVHCISRRDNPDLHRRARELDTPLYYNRFDLKDLDHLPAVVQTFCSSIGPATAEMVALVNNAGVLDPVGAVGNVDGSVLAENVVVNLIAPMVLTAEFMKLVASWTCRRVVLSISSGAARHPYAGLSGYCSSKAGLDMFTSCIGAEQERLSDQIIAISVAPGVVDTPMQERIRSVGGDVFPPWRRFVDMKESGSLASPGEVALKLAGVLEDKHVKTGSVIDIR